MEPIFQPEATEKEILKQWPNKEGYVSNRYDGGADDDRKYKNRSCLSQVQRFLKGQQ
ncbi:hypothetical protein JCM12296A_01540 [Desulfosarcina cetonica]